MRAATTAATTAAPGPVDADGTCAPPLVCDIGDGGKQCGMDHGCTGTEENGGELDTAAMTTSELVQERLNGARYVRAIGNILAHHIPSLFLMGSGRPEAGCQSRPMTPRPKTKSQYSLTRWHSTPWMPGGTPDLEA